MVVAQLQDWKLLLAPSTCFCHIPAPCWAWATPAAGLNGKEMLVCRWEGALIQPVASETGQCHNICLVWRLPRFCSESDRGPAPKGCDCRVCPPQAVGPGHLGLPRLRRKLRLGAENKLPFFVGKCSDLKCSDSLISGFESHTLIIRQD